MWSIRRWGLNDRADLPLQVGAGVQHPHRRGRQPRRHWCATCRRASPRLNSGRGDDVHRSSTCASPRSSAWRAYGRFEVIAEGFNLTNADNANTYVASADVDPRIRHSRLASPVTSARSEQRMAQLGAAARLLGPSPVRRSGGRARTARPSCHWRPSARAFVSCSPAVPCPAKTTSSAATSPLGRLLGDVLREQEWRGRLRAGRGAARGHQGPALARSQPARLRPGRAGRCLSAAAGSTRPRCAGWCARSRCTSHLRQRGRGAPSPARAEPARVRGGRRAAPGIRRRGRGGRGHGGSERRRGPPPAGRDGRRAWSSPRTRRRPARRTVLHKLRALARLAEALDDPRLTPEATDSLHDRARW